MCLHLHYKYQHTSDPTCPTSSQVCFFSNRKIHSLTRIYNEVVTISFCKIVKPPLIQTNASVLYIFKYAYIFSYIFKCFLLWIMFHFNIISVYYLLSSQITAVAPHLFMESFLFIIYYGIHKRYMKLLMQNRLINTQNREF